MSARATIIVVTYNSRAHLPRLKATIEAQTAPHDLIVWDNGSRADQRPMPAELPANAVFVQSEENLGFAPANNRAAERATTEFVVLLNPDAFPEPDWLAQLIAAADAHSNAAAFGSTQWSAEDDALYDGLGDCYHAAGVPWRGGYGWRRDASPPLTGQVFSPCAAAALYRADVWRALGGFDERFFCYCEDVDLGFRMRLAGHDCLQIGAAKVAHVGGASSGKRSEFAVFYGTRNRLWTFVKNMPGALLLPLIFAHTGITLLFLAVSPFRGTGPATWRGVGAALKGLPAILASRRTRPRKVKLGVLMRAFAWSPFALARRAPVVR
ncbi:glycosyltransferase [alpha proteobacterium U9-1i]|nr:glycosyltransferase [alpha proteobacterium U9-1i]